MAVREGRFSWERHERMARKQSEAPYHMWCRPSGQKADQTRPRTQIANLASFYQGSSEPIETTIPSRYSKKPYHLMDSTI